MTIGDDSVKFDQKAVAPTVPDAASTALCLGLSLGLLALIGCGRRTARVPLA